MVAFSVDELAGAALRGEIVAEYQIQVDLASGRTVAVEALSRWLHPRAGMIPPEDFIASAEATGAIVAIDRCVLRLGCESAANWEQLGHPIDISVNASLAHIGTADFADAVLRCVDETGIDPHRLTVEITETQDPAAFTRSGSELARIAAEGIGVSIDDFGTGFAAEAVLDLLPATELKIDRSLIVADDTEPARRAADIALARGLRLVAEGVATPAQWDLAVEIGCHRAQGFLVSRPVQPAEIGALLHA